MKEPVKGMKWAKWPLGDVTQWFGENPELYQKYGSTKAHNGIDIVRPYGEHLFAVEDGIIAYVDNEDAPRGYGRNLRLLHMEHGEGREWVYAHLKAIHVKEGEQVKAGQFIAEMGNSGFVVSNATGNGFWDANPYAGTHVHLGVRDVVHDADGFKYAGYSRKVRVLDYSNGYKGRYDFLDMFLPPALKSSKLIRLASALQNATVYQLGKVLQSIGL